MARTTDWMTRTCVRFAWRAMVPPVCALGLLLNAGPAQADAAHEQICTLDLGPRVTVVGVENSETLKLSDGRHVSLIGALGPRPPLNTDDPANWPAEHNARLALEKLVLGRDVRLGVGPTKWDRYGRLLAHVFAWHEGRRYWVQGELLAHGHARAYALPDHRVCLRELLAHERLAQSPRRGLWLRRPYRVLRPSPPGWLLSNRRHNFELIEGQVRNVAVVRGKIYLNFGTNWRQDFTAATTRKAVQARGFIVDQIKALKGKRIRVRGWIERRNGPFIKLADPNLIEVTDPEITRPETGAPPALVASDDQSNPDAPLWIRKRRLPMPRLRSPEKEKSAR